MTMDCLFKQLYTEKYGEKITREIAEMLVRGFAVTDGSNRTDGEKWKFEEAVSLGEQMGANWDMVPKCEFYLVLNMMYSDHYKTGKKHGMSDSFYGELTCDWFNDADGDDGKTFRYFIHL